MLHKTINQLSPIPRTPTCPRKNRDCKPEGLAAQMLHKHKLKAINRKP